MINSKPENFPLKGKQFLICVTGSIAAYKACDTIRLLRKEGAEVQVMMTSSAKQFVGRATFAALTNHPVLTEIFPDTPKAGLEHIQMALSLDAVIVLPATANILGKVSSAVADDLVSTTLSVCEQPTLFVPAMNFRMWQNPAVMVAVEKLRERGKIVLDPESGQLASLHEGEGRLPDQGDIMNAIRSLFHIPQPLLGKTVLITAGPTREPIDPVRFISNRSSGKMGYALAEKARDMGANVIVISGPVNLPAVPEVQTVQVETAAEMFLAVQNALRDNTADYLFMTAAVADYTPESPSLKKLKRSQQDSNLKLVPTPDILNSISRNPGIKIIAFALETENGEAEALRKLKDKKADFIVLNYANEAGAGFEVNTNRVTVFSKSGSTTELKKDRKDRIARRILEIVIS